LTGVGEKLAKQESHKKETQNNVRKKQNNQYL